MYFISGLGADEKVFKHIHLPSHCIPVHLPWIPPRHNESLHHYALRLAEGIDTKEKFSLIGLSFGGMIAIEIAKTYGADQTILISSIPVSTDLPGYYKLAGVLRLHKVVPISMVKVFARLKRLFTAETSEDKQMLRMMIQNSDPKFIRWAFHAILTWKNTDRPKQLFHIHGVSDLILPTRFTKPDHTVKGGHMVILTEARAINSLLQEIFKKEYASTIE